MFLNSAQHHEDPSWAYGDTDDVNLTHSKRVVWLSLLLAITALTWAWFSPLDEVSTGSGKVVPLSREQVIQSLDGGIVASLRVRQDDLVEAGQVLALLDPTRTESNVEESAAKYRAALASATRLAAEVNQTDLVFPPELDAWPELKTSERKLFNARRSSLEEQERWLRESLALVRKELAISESLAKTGAASTTEVLRLRRQSTDLQLRLTDLRAEYTVQAREELAKANAEIKALSSVVRGRTDSLTRLTFRAPVRGIVKNIEVSTIGGVVPPNGRLMEIVPLDDQLLIEARIAPRDIAFIHPGQRASVKITAYDYSVYGALEGAVTTISPDTIRDEVTPEIHYYRVFIQTESNALVNKAGKEFPIVPGMIATVDIHTGSRTVFEYLTKPLNRAREALRER